MLVLFSAVMLVLVGTFIDGLFRDMSLAILAIVGEGLLAGVAPPESDMSALLTQIRGENLTSIAFITAAITVVFGYLLARVALGPTRGALASQKQFIGNIAHELRTPLSIIKTNTEVRLMDPTITPESRAINESNVEELDRLAHIINNLLTLSGSFQPERMEFKAVDVAAVADTVVEKLSDLSKRKALEVTMRRGYASFVWGNPAGLEQILMNIIKNAITFTNRNGHVAITIEDIANERVEIVVQDSGAGIPRADLFHIFEPFYRADISRNRARGGSGLGLTIVSELVKMHRGKITVRSAVGRGTTVVVSLPAAPSPRHDHTIKTRTALDEVAVDFSHRRM